MTCCYGCESPQILARPCETNRYLLIDIEDLESTTLAADTFEACAAAVVAHIAGNSQVASVERQPRHRVQSSSLRAGTTLGKGSPSELPDEDTFHTANENARRWLAKGAQGMSPDGNRFPFNASGKGKIV